PSVGRPYRTIRRGRRVPRRRGGRHSTRVPPHPHRSDRPVRAHPASADRRDRALFRERTDGHRLRYPPVVPSRSGDQHLAEFSTSSSRASALSSLVFSASASSLTRICRALASIRFSPAERPRSLSRRYRSRTTSATLLTSPDASFSRLAL